MEELELDPAFLERDARRKAGEPVEIARTRRLLIRETILSDVPGLYAIWKSLPEPGYMPPLQPTLSEELEFMKAYISHAYAFYDFGLWTVLEQETGQIVGRAGLFPSELLEEGVELGYLIAPQKQRQGYGRECAEAVVRYAFETLDLPELWLAVDSRNLPSIRLAGSLGFQYQGMKRTPDGVLQYYRRRLEES